MPLEIQKLRVKTIDNKDWQGCGEMGAFSHSWQECRLMQASQVELFLQKLKIEPPYGPAAPFLAGHRHWPTHQCPSVDEWKKEM